MFIADQIPNTPSCRPNRCPIAHDVAAQYESLQLQSAQLKWWQKSILFAQCGFSGLSINLFFAGVSIMPFVLSSFAFDLPGDDQSNIELDPRKSYSARVWMLTSLASFALIHLAVWINVYTASANNSFSKNPEDWNTGDLRKAARTVKDDGSNARWARVHNNLLENVPMHVMVSFAMLLCRPSEGAVNCFMVPFPIIRLVHMIWYASAGSHEIRATLFSFGLFCTVGCVAQCVVYCFGPW